MKKNPRKIPRTQADVDKAWNQGVLDGVSNSSAIFLTVLVDKYEFAEQVLSFWRDVTKLSEEIKEGRATISDLKRVLREEYDVEV